MKLNLNRISFRISGKWILQVLIILILQPAHAQKNAGSAFAHPPWSLQSNIYEVNLRQYSKEGNISAFIEQLPRLKNMGVEILWFMPITPIGEKGRKMELTDLGSYYAVKDYTSVNPEFGTMSEFVDLVKQAHKMGFKVITDWVANHSAIDNYWVDKHPEYYVKDSSGNFVSPFDWTDVYKLDYSNKALWDEMTAAMLFWIQKTDIDGFRCDVAEEVDPKFWAYAIAKLKAQKDVFMLAEGESPICHEAGFDATYNWSAMRQMQDLYNKKISLATFKKMMTDDAKKIPDDAMRMFFTSNHDENSWNGTEFQKYGAAYKTFAVFTQTMRQSIPLIYSGQESENKKRLKFFVRDPIPWKKYALKGFYSDLLRLRRSNPALATDAEIRLLKTSKDDFIYAYERSKNDHKVIVILNLSPISQSFTINDKSITGKPIEIFSQKQESASDSKPITLKAWEYKVYNYR